MIAWTEVRHAEKAYRLQAPVRQARMDPLADGPDVWFAGQGGESLHRVVGDDVVELAHKTLVGTEHDGADIHRARATSFVPRSRGCRLDFPKARAEPKLHGAIVVA